MASSEESFYQSLGKYWQLNQNNQETEHIQMQTNGTQKVVLINRKTLKNYAKRLN